MCFACAVWSGPCSLGPAPSAAASHVTDFLGLFVRVQIVAAKTSGGAVDQGGIGYTLGLN